MMTYTEFFVQYPALMYVIMSLIFYLLNDKLVLASVAEIKMSLFHLELVYLWLFVDSVCHFVILCFHCTLHHENGMGRWKTGREDLDMEWIPACSTGNRENSDILYNSHKTTY